MQRAWTNTVLAFFLLSVPLVQSVNTLAAQSASTMSGQWQGSLVADKPSRILLIVDQASSNPTRAVVYLLDGDNASWPHATSSFVLQGHDVTFRVANLDISFKGQLAADGILSGAWQQHGTVTSVTLAHVSGDAAWAVPSSGGKNMAANADPAFDVVTIKPADPKDTGSGFQLRGERLHVRNESLESIVAFSYGIHRGQIQGAPAWFATDKWEIDGLADTPGTPNLQQMRTIFRKLVEDRFQLKMTKVKRELPVYLLEVDRAGPKLTKSLGDPNGPPDSTGNQNNGINDMRYTDMTLDEFAEDLAFSEDRPVLNSTNLPGRYDFRLQWASPDAAAASATVGTDAPPVLFTAIREQLGLTLKPARTPATVYEISHVAKPSSN